jgi:hypothetical protein
MEGTSFEEDLAAVAAGIVTLRRPLGRLHQAASAELGPLFAELDALKTLAEAAQGGVLAAVWLAHVAQPPPPTPGFACAGVPGRPGRGRR